MSKAKGIVAVASLLAFGLSTSAVAQGRPGKGGPPLGRMYDTKMVETITGEVLAINTTSPGRGMGGRAQMGGGIQLMVKTDKEEIAVHLGPKRYIDEQAVKLAVKDRVEIRGSRVTQAGKPLIIAAEVKKGDQVLKLRDEAGLPLWRGKGQMQGRQAGPGATPPGK